MNRTPPEIPPRPNRVLLLPRYGADQASSRQRFFAMLPALSAGGLACTCEPFFGPDFLSLRFGDVHSRWRKIGSAYVRRARWLRRASDFDVVYVQIESLPYVPAAIEKRLLRGRPRVVLDLDDAWDERYRRHPIGIVRDVLSGKVERLMASAAAVVVGSEYLRERAERLNSHVTFIPTGLDLSSVPRPEMPSPKAELLHVGWIGSPTTVVHLGLIAPVLRRLCAEGRVRVTIVGGGPESRRFDFAECFDWTPENEADVLRRMDVGIMPLHDDEFSRGKCGYKIIQYMAAGKPVIASPVGGNTLVVRGGVNGYLADSDEDWLQALEALRAAPEERFRLGREGRLIAEREYDLSTLAGRLLRVLNSAASGGLG